MENYLSSDVVGKQKKYFCSRPSEDVWDDILMHWGLTWPFGQLAKDLKAKLDNEYKSFTNPQVMRRMVDKALSVLKKASDKGEELCELADTKVVAIIAMPGAPGGFTPPKLAGPQGRGNNACGYILWDPFQDFIYYGTDVGITKYWVERIPPWIVLGHELGHFKQYLEDGKWVVDVMKEKYKSVKSQSAEYGRSLDWPRNIKDNEHPICKKRNYGLRQGYPSNNRSAAYLKGLKEDQNKSRESVKKAKCPSLSTMEGESKVNSELRKVMDAGQKVVKLLNSDEKKYKRQRYSNDGNRLVERAVATEEKDRVELAYLKYLK